MLRVDEPDAAGGDPLQRVDLVLHQRDQRRDDQRQVIADQRRQLVAERLAGACRHHDERVATVDRGLHCSLLTGPEGGEPEVLGECGVKVHPARDHSGAS